MKTTKTLTILFICIFNNLFCQINIPPASPSASISQSIGFSNVSINYSRPALKGRDMFKILTREGEVWRTGANMCTILSTDGDIYIEGNKIPTGKYSIYSIPDKDTWVIIINNKISWGTQYDPTEDFIRIPVKTLNSNEYTESFGFYFDDVDGESAIMGFSWGNTKVELNVKAEIHDEILHQIEVVTAINGRDKNLDYFNASQYYITNNLSSEKALIWAKIFADEIMPKEYWAVALKARAYAYNKEYDKAIIVGEKVIEMAKLEHNNDYVVSYRNLVEKWKKLIIE
ncbi:DUF2911 domain-containing protein [Wenyingzhuangia sp. IMCC45467]